MRYLIGVLIIGSCLAGSPRIKDAQITDAEAELFERLSGMATAAEVARDNVGRALAKKCEEANTTLQRDPSRGGRIACLPLTHTSDAPAVKPVAPTAYPDH
jgi:hypothetical protein